MSMKKLVRLEQGGAGEKDKGYGGKLSSVKKRFSAGDNMWTGRATDKSINRIKEGRRCRK